MLKYPPLPRSVFSTQWSKCRWVAHPNNVLSSFEEQNNLSSEELEWVKDDLFIYSGGWLFILEDKLDIVEFGLLS